MDTKDGAKRVKWRPYITTKNGRRIWAKSYGLKAFPIQDPSDRHRDHD